MWVISWCNVTLWAIFAQRVSNRIRFVYFAKCLELDAAFYDENNPNEMSAKIAKEVSAINRGLGEKNGMIFMSVWCFIFGFGFAFYWGWLLTLILCAAFPFLMLVGMGMAASLQSGMVAQMRAYAQSAGYAEQALHAIRVVHSYCQEELEIRNYTQYLDRAKQVQAKSGLINAGGQSIIFLVILGFYAFCFFWGGYLKYNNVVND